MSACPSIGQLLVSNADVKTVCGATSLYTTSKTHVLFLLYFLISVTADMVNILYGLLNITTIDDADYTV